MKNSKVKISGITILFVLIYLVILKSLGGPLIDYCSTSFVIFSLALLIGIKLKVSSNFHYKIIGFSLIWTVVILMIFILILFFNAFSNLRC